MNRNNNATSEKKRFLVAIRNLAKFPTEGPYPVFSIDNDGTLLYSNTASQPLTGKWIRDGRQTVPENWRVLVNDALVSGKPMRTEETHIGRVFLFDFVPLVKEGYVNVYSRDITELREAETRQAADLKALTRMHELSLRPLEAGFGLTQLLQEIMDAAVSIMGAQKGTLQLLDERDSLRIVAHHAHDRPFLEFLTSAENQALVCAEALKRRERVLIPDVEDSILFAGTPTLGILREAKVRAIQCTPVIGRGGAMLGILTTHWEAPYSPDERDLWRLDLLVRQAADMIEQARAEDLLRKSEESLLEAQRIAGVGSWEWDPVTDSLVWSEEMYRIIGLDQKQTPAKFGEAKHLYSAESWARLYSAVQRATKTGEPYSVEVEILPPDGTRRWVMARGEALRGLDGKTLRLRGTVQDITERKEAEDALRESEESYRRIVETSQEGIMVSDIEGKITFVNERMAGILGYTVTELLGRSGLDFVVERDRLRRAKAIAIDRPKGVSELYEVWSRRKDGSEICLLTSAAPIYDSEGHHVGNLGLHTDITERKRLEIALKSSEEQLRTVVESISDGFYAVDHEWNYTFVNNRAARAIGLKPEHMLGKNLWELVPRLVGTDFAKNVREAMTKRQPCHFEWKGPNVDFWSDYSVYPTSNGLSVYWTDITERRRAEDALRQTRDYLDSLFNYANAPIIVWDPEFRITRFNHAFEDLTGYTESEVLGKDLSVLFPEENKADSLAKIRHTLSERWEAVAIPIQRKDGQVRIALWNSANVYDKDGVTLVSTIAQGQDITEPVRMREKLEQYAKNLEKLVEERTTALREAERLSAIGETTLMVGHDIRNPLQTVMGELYLARSEIESMPGGEAKQMMYESLSTIDEQISYIDKIVRDLQDYARPLKPEMSQVNIGELLETVLSTVTIPKDVRTLTKVEDGLPTLAVDRVLLRRALSNLVTNAVQAMPEGGDLTLVARKDGAESLLVSVEDTGVGIPESVRPRLFRPLTTSKSKGQGLGLAVCKRIVEAHNGSISYESDLGKGTKFTVKLPINNSS